MPARLAAMSMIAPTGSPIKDMRAIPGAGSFDWSGSSVTGWGIGSSTIQPWTRRNLNGSASRGHASARTPHVWRRSNSNRHTMTLLRTRCSGMNASLLMNAARARTRYWLICRPPEPFSATVSTPGARMLDLWIPVTLTGSYVSRAGTNAQRRHGSILPPCAALRDICIDLGLPLPHQVGAALAAYLRSGRPSCLTRRVFVRRYAPVDGFQSSAAIGHIVRRSLARAGVERSGRGAAHLLRHSLATRMLRNGASLEEIGQILRHRSPDSTRIYAKVDLNSLRPMAPTWPGGAV